MDSPLAFDYPGLSAWRSPYTARETIARELIDCLMQDSFFQTQLILGDRYSYNCSRMEWDYKIPGPTGFYPSKGIETIKTDEVAGIKHQYIKHNLVVSRLSACLSSLIV